MLREWAENEGKLWRYSRPTATVFAAKLVSPGAAGFKPYLYEIPGEAPDKAQLIESQFMSSLDSHAAEAHQILLDLAPWEWNTATRSGWSRFILSLWLRTPASVAAYKQAIGKLWGSTVPEVAAKYAELKKPGDPDTFEEYMTGKDPLVVDKVAMVLLQKSIDHQNLGQRINNMKWTTLTLNSSPIDFLISDNPVISTNALGHKNAHIAMPISPRKMFIAFNDNSTFEKLSQGHELAIVKEINKFIVQRAREFVGAASDGQRGFVEKHFGTKLAPTLAETLATKYGNQESEAAS